jgi:protoporphyrinogen oxidase
MAMTTQHYKHIVIGAGISGLSAAYFSAKKGIHTLVLERTARLGGCMQTYRFPELNHFWLEAGSHSAFNSYGHLITILEELQILPDIIAKEKAPYQLWRRGSRQHVMRALHPFELLWSLPRLFRLNKDDCSVYDYYGRGLGARNYRDLFGPAFRSVLCQTADDFPASALFRKKPRRKDVERNFTFPTGLGHIPQVLAEHPNIEVRLEHPVTALTATDTGYQVTVGHDQDQITLTADTVTLAVPPDYTATLIQNVLPDAAGLLAPIGIAEIDTLLLVFPQAALRLPRIAGLISIDGPFLSAVSRDFFEDSRYRGFAFHFSDNQLDHAAARIAAACQALGTNPDTAHSITWTTNRLPSLRTGHDQLVNRLDQLLRGKSLGITGNWFQGVSIEDCVTRSYSEHQRLFQASTDV